MTRHRPWLVVNQSQSPQFQTMLEEIADAIGPGELLTGMSFPSGTERLRTLQGPPYDRASVMRRIGSWTAFTLAATGRLLFGRRPRFILVTTNPPSLPGLAWLASRLRRVPYVLLYWDLYPDHAVLAGWLRDNGMLARLWRRMNRAAMRRAAAVVTIGVGMAQRLRAQSDGVEIEVIPNWADTAWIRPLPKERNPLSTEYGALDRLTVLYSGNIGMTHGVDRLVAAAAEFAPADDVSFVIVGDGLGLAAAEEVARQNGARNVRFVPRQPWDALPLSLAVGDIAVVIQEPGTEHLSVPSKLYSSLAAGSAILALTSDDSDLAALVREFRFGQVSAPHPRAIADAIRVWQADPSLLNAMRARARRAAEEHFSREVIAQRMKDLFSRAGGIGAVA